MKFLIYLISLVTFTFAHSGSGGAGGHGGDGKSFEFYSTGKVILHELSLLSKDELKEIHPQLTVDEFKYALEKTRVISTQEDLFVDGKNVDAKNVIEKNLPVIYINRDRWVAHKDNIVTKMALVAHEYLGITKSLFDNGEWNHYLVSENLISKLKIKFLNKYYFSIDFMIPRLALEFKNSQIPKDSDVQTKFNWSCVEYSALKNYSIKSIHLNAYLFTSHKQATVTNGLRQPSLNFEMTGDGFFREWKEKILIDDKEEVFFQEVLRVNKDGDLIIELSQKGIEDNQNASLFNKDNGVVSYLKCSRLGSETSGVLDFLYLSLAPIFEVTETKDFEVYTAKMNRLIHSISYKMCFSMNIEAACWRFIDKFGKVKLNAEAQAVKNAKTNILKINSWLDSLGEKKKFEVNVFLLRLFNQYASHQSDIRQMMDIGDLYRPYLKEPFSGVKNFIDTINITLPKAYSDKKIQFKKEYQDAMEKLILELN